MDGWMNFIDNYDIYELLLIELMNEKRDQIFKKILTKMSKVLLDPEIHKEDILEAHENVFKEACAREDNTFIEILINLGMQLNLDKDDKGLSHVISVNESRVNKAKENKLSNKACLAIF